MNRRSDFRHGSSAHRFSGEITRVMRAQEEVSAELLQYRNVVGTATGYRVRQGRVTREVCVIVYVSSKQDGKTLPRSQRIPAAVTGPDGAPAPTDVVEVGRIRPLQDSEQYRPVPGGCSISSPLVAWDAGTLGGYAWDPLDEEFVFLTCAHVLTFSPDLTTLPSKTEIIQPAKKDGGTWGDVIGRSKRISPIYTSATKASAPANPVDAGIGVIAIEESDFAHSVNFRVLEVGPALFEWTEPYVEMYVQKRGRTTRLTKNGWITAVNAKTVLNFGTEEDPAWAQIGQWLGAPSVFQITTTDGKPFADLGDSGAVVFAQTKGRLGYVAVGLLFAEGGGGTSVWACTIDSLILSLGITPVCSFVEREALKEGAPPDSTEAALTEKRTQLRLLWDEVLPNSPVGHSLLTLVEATAPELAKALVADQEVRRLTREALAAWDWTSLDDLATGVVDERRVAAVEDLMSRVASAAPRKVAAAASEVARLVLQAKGSPVQSLLDGRTDRGDRSRRRGS